MTTATPPDAGDLEPEDPNVDPDDAGFPDSPELADGDAEFTDDEGEPIDVAGDSAD